MNYRTGTERLQFITPDNVVYNLHNPPFKAVIAEEGFGMPSANMYTTTGAYQHGSSPVAYTLEPRDVSVTIRHSGNSRSEYWENRSNLLEMMKLGRSFPNMPTSGKLRKIYYVNGVRHKRDLDVFFDGGLEFNTPPRNTWDAWGIDETITFKAYNPVWYNPTPHVVTLAGGNNTINYAGSWEEYPSFSITGLFVNLGIRNVETDIRIVIAGLPAGETLAITLTYGSKSVVNTTTGVSYLNYLTLASNLSNFSLLPHPLLTNGVNTIQVATDAGGPTVTMTYYDRYGGI